MLLSLLTQATIIIDWVVINKRSISLTILEAESLDQRARMIGFGEDLLLDCTLLVSHCSLMWQKVSKTTFPGIKALILFIRPHPSQRSHLNTITLGDRNRDRRPGAHQSCQ
jgi:hypothetical protein